MKIVFFDIDGTLLDCKQSGRSAFVKALHTTFGWTDNIEYIDFTGATDLDVIARIFANYDRELTEADIDSFFGVLPLELEQSCRANPPLVFPGVRELLNSLAKRKDILVGLVTGNIESCARIKLKYAGIDQSFELGAFGHEHADRNEIARLALKRAGAFNSEGHAIEKVFIVGDSPSDVRAAKAIGAVAVAVATGRPSHRELAEAGADLVLDNLTPLNQVLPIFD